jgi:Icc-related predicted phosphoesterase
MKIVCLSDTHGYHNRMKNPVPDGDVLVCAGDITVQGEIQGVTGFAYWLSELPHPHKVIICGNHDFCFENSFRRLAIDTLKGVTGVHYLEDEEIVIDGIKFYGSPWQPEFCDWAFNLPRGEKLQEKWDRIPADTDVLITHGPPLGVMDHTYYDNIDVGCENLARTIMTRLTKLKLHVFGHIHEGYGFTKAHWDDGLTFVNASICDLRYNPINKPIEVDIGDAHEDQREGQEPD